MSDRTRENALILENRMLMPGVFEMRLAAPVIAGRTQPGQFVFARVGTATDPLLRRPISICDVERDVGEISLLYRVVGRGTDRLSALPAGQTLDMLGPIGTPFPLDGGEKPLVVAGGMGIAPLSLLVRRLFEAGTRATVYYGVSDKEHCFLQETLERRCDLTVVPEAELGFVTDRLPVSGAFTRAYACGPVEMLTKVADWAKHRGLTGYVSLEEKMGCGIGACSGCAFPMHNGKGGVAYKKVCVDGPVFPLEEVKFHG